MAGFGARQVFTHPVHFLACGFGAGLSPKAPGTAGTVAAIPLYLLLAAYAGPVLYLAVTAAAFLAGIFLCGYTARATGLEDPKCVVWDEIVGYLAAMAFLPLGWAWIAAGFALFRLFDIWKPWPIRWLDRRLKGGLGIMLDDLVAGSFACVILNLAAFVLKL